MKYATNRPQTRQSFTLSHKKSNRDEIKVKKQRFKGLGIWRGSGVNLLKSGVLYEGWKKFRSGFEAFHEAVGFYGQDADELFEDVALVD